MLVETHRGAQLKKLFATWATANPPDSCHISPPRHLALSKRKVKSTQKAGCLISSDAAWEPEFFLDCILFPSDRLHPTSMRHRKPEDAEIDDGEPKVLDE